jgi:tetratricopeptide (TPR) repeat protein
MASHMIHVDLNARTENDRVRLSTRTAAQSLKGHSLQPGEWVWLTDDELRVGAQIETANGQFFARPEWKTRLEIVTHEDVSHERVLAARTELERLVLSGDLRANAEEILRVLPVARRTLGDSAGWYFEAQALAALGFFDLALLSAREAVAADPSNPRWTWLELNVRRRISLDDSLIAARTAASAFPRSAIILETFAQILSERARVTPSPRQAQICLEVLDATASMDMDPPGLDPHPIAFGSLRIMRGFALQRLGRMEEAAREFESAVQVNPGSGEVYLARGVFNYPSESSIADLQRSIELGGGHYWAPFFLAHHEVGARRWRDAEVFAYTALARNPPPLVRASLLGWLAIVDVEQRGDLASAQERLDAALRLNQASSVLRGNRARLDALRRSPSGVPPWNLEAERSASPGAEGDLTGLFARQARPEELSALSTMA